MLFWSDTQKPRVWRHVFWFVWYLWEALFLTFLIFILSYCIHAQKHIWYISVIGYIYSLKSIPVIYFTCVFMIGYKYTSWDKKIKKTYHTYESTENWFILTTSTCLSGWTVLGTSEISTILFLTIYIYVWLLDIWWTRYHIYIYKRNRSICKRILKNAIDIYNVFFKRHIKALDMNMCHIYIHRDTHRYTYGGFHIWGYPQIDGL